MSMSFVKSRMLPSSFLATFIRMNFRLYQIHLLHVLIWLYHFSCVLGEVVVVNHIDFWVLNQSFSPEVNCTWSWCIILSIWCWVLFAMGLEFCIWFHEGQWSVVFFYYIFGFNIKVKLASQNELGTCPSSSIFWKNFGRFRVISSCLGDITSEGFFVGRCLSTESIFKITVALFGLYTHIRTHTYPYI